MDLINSSHNLLNGQKTDQETFDIFDREKVDEYGDSYSKTKASQYAEVLGDTSPGVDVIYSDIKSGNSNVWDKKLKYQEDIKVEAAKNSLIRQLANDPDMEVSQKAILANRIASSNLSSTRDVEGSLQRAYSSKYVDTAVSLPSSNIAQEEIESDEVKSVSVMDVIQEQTQKLMIAHDSMNKLQKRNEDVGIIPMIGSWFVTLIPLYNNILTRDAVKEAPHDSWMYGNSLDEQVRYLYSLPPEEFRDRLDKAIKHIESGNPLLAQDFADAVISFPGSDIATVPNIVEALDVASIVPLTKLGKGLKSGIKAVLKDPSSAQDISKALSSLGSHKESSILSLANDISEGDPSGLARLNKHLPQRGSFDTSYHLNSSTATGLKSSSVTHEDIEQRLPSIFAPAKALEGSMDMGSVSHNRARSAIERSVVENPELFEKIALVDRLQPHQVQEAAEEVFDTIKDMFTNVNHNIIDMRVIPAEDAKLTNIASVVVRFGQKDGTSFASEKAAKNFVERNIGPKTNDYSIVQDSLGGYLVEVGRSVSEVNRIRDMTIPTEFLTPDPIMGRIFSGKTLSPDYQLPKQQIKARGVTTHSSERMIDYLSEELKPISSLDKEKKVLLEKVLRSHAVESKFARSDSELAADYLKINNRVISPEEIDAYNTVTRIYDIDYTVRDADLVKQKIRLGGERFSFSYKDNLGKPKSLDFDGVPRSSIPYGSKDPFIINIIENSRLSKRYTSKFIDHRGKDLIEDKLKDGYKIILNPENVTYYVIKDFKRDRIPLASLGYKPGGHHEYQFDHFIKQGQIKESNRISRYVGDTTLASVPTKEHAQKISELLEEGRKMIYNGTHTESEIRAFFRDSLSDFMDYDKFMKSVKKGLISLDTPFIATRKGQRTTDVSQYLKGIKDVIDATESEHNVFRAVNTRYVTERSDRVLDVYKSEGNRIIKTDHGALLSPYETLRKTVNSIVDTRIMNDYRQAAAADWVQEFGSMIDAPLNRVYSNPYYYMKNPVWKSGADKSRLNIAENVRLRTLELSEYKSTSEALVENYKDKILNKVYDKFGEKGLNLTNSKILPALTSVDSFMRSVAFHEKLGLFNVKHLFVQAQEVAKIGMISPVQALKSSTVLPWNKMALLTENEEILKGLSKKVSSFSGMNGDNWLEMIQSYKDSGFSLVKSDIAYLDSIAPKNIVSKGGVRTVLQYGTKFYEEGEGIARSLAYSTAYNEWRAVNPSSKFDRFARASVLQRAKNLVTNMTKESNSTLQKGFTGIVTQFMGYHARLAEQVLDGGLWNNGSKLNRMEKLRLLTGMTALYGIAAPVTVVAPFLDWKKRLKDWMTEEGVDIDSPGMQLFLDGFVPSALSTLFGSHLDMSNSYGPGNIQFFEDLVSDKPFIETLLGVSGSTMADTLRSVSNLVSNVIIDIGDWNEEDRPSLSVLRDDLIEPFKNIASVNTALRTWEAINTGRWLSKSGSVLADDITVSEAITSAILGSTPSRVSNSYYKQSVKYNTNEKRREYYPEIRSNLAKMVSSSNSGDGDAAKKYFSRAKSAAIRGGLSQREWNSLVSQGLSETSFTERAEKTFEQYKMNKMFREENKY